MHICVQKADAHAGLCGHRNGDVHCIGHPRYEQTPRPRQGAGVAWQGAPPAVVDLPTPPLPDATATIWLTPGMPSRATGGPWRMAIPRHRGAAAHTGRAAARGQSLRRRARASRRTSPRAICRWMKPRTAIFCVLQVRRQAMLPFKSGYMWDAHHTVFNSARASEDVALQAAALASCPPLNTESPLPRARPPCPRCQNMTHREQRTRNP